jgi:hypothetical protein
VPELRVDAGEPLSGAEDAPIERLPEVAERLIHDIPRLESICTILSDQTTPLEAAPAPGARILRIAQDYDLLETQRLPVEHALAILQGRDGRYDPDFLAVFVSLRGDRHADDVVELPLAAVRLGMCFADDVRIGADDLLIARGHEVTHALLERIEHLPREIAGVTVRVTAAPASAC